jgi:5-methylcytosine-specific restriction endonuclease McrA
MEVKVCTDCGVEKTINEYYKKTRGKYGVRGICKACHKLRVTMYRQTEKGKEVRQKTRFKYRHSEKGIEASKRGISKYRKTDKGKDAQKRSSHIRRAKVQDAGTYTNEQWQERLAEYNYCCAYCYKPFPVNELTVDHMQPISRGGTNTIDNLVPACKPCNSRKKDKTPLEMLQKGLM